MGFTREQLGPAAQVIYDRAKGTHQAAPKRSKYNSKFTRVDGILFHSKKEADRYSELVLMRMGGSVIRFHRQVIFDLPGGVTYVCDFLIFYTDSRVVYEDAKGFRTREYIDKKKMVEAIYKVTIVES